MAGEETKVQPKPAPVLAAAPAPAPASTPGLAPAPSPATETAENEGADSSNAGDKTSKKRPAADEAPGAAPTKQTKRRAARACVSCRARKVRCDVVEGAPCGNCRWDKVECVVQESRRRKKNIFTSSTAGLPSVGAANANAEAIQAKLPDAAPGFWRFAGLRRASDGSLLSVPATESGTSGILGTLSQFNNAGVFDRSMSTSACDAAFLSRLQQARQQNAQSSAANSNQFPFLGNSIGQDTTLFPHLSRTQHFLNTLEQPDPLSQLPAFIKPLPTRFSADDIKYLHAKGALTLPSLGLQNACLRCFVEFVHPYMPLMDMREFLSIVNDREGAHGQVSLLLYQAVMFVSCAFVEMKYLRDAGYVTRKDARRAFFYKTRHLYDLDYESDRLVLVQALLLMSYWYETPDDQKDTWHWMGVAISLAHTIGLHRNPTTASMSMRKQKHWKRIWWSCFMRDRMVALGMRRPTRIKDEDFDVPMLEEDDFEIEPLPDDIALISPDCTLLRDVGKQAQLAHMCIAKAKLCILIGRMLKTQYSVLIRDRTKPTDTTGSTMMLFPNKKLENIESVATCDLDLIQWLSDLPPACQYRPLSPLDIKNGNATIAVQRNLLHMVYYTTVSALHRPQFLPSSPHQVPTASRQVQETSRLRVRDSAMQITRMAAELHSQRIDRYLQTTGVTVILPAMIIHLLDMKSPIEQARERAAKGFKSCMRVMIKLREMYSAADYAIGFLDAALQKASIDMQTLNRRESAARAAAAAAQAAPVSTPGPAGDQLNTPPPDNVPYLNSTEVSLFHQNRSYIPACSKTNAISGATAPAHATSHHDAVAHTPAADKDFDSAVCMTPSAISSHSSDHGTNDSSGFGFAAGSMGEDFDWNEAFSGGNLDLDQWLVYPPAEGVSGADAFNVDNMAGMMYNETAVAAAKAAEEANLALVDNMISWPEEELDKQQQQPTPADASHDAEAQVIAQLATA